MRSLLAAAAMIALASTGAAANPGKGKGHDQSVAAQPGEKGPGRHADKGAHRGPGKGHKASNSPPRQGDKAVPQNRRGGRNDVANPGQAINRVVEKNTRGARNAVKRPQGEAGPASRGLRNLAASSGLIEGCPPGLARKNSGCLPPGQAKKQFGYSDNWRGQNFSPSFFGLGNLSPGRYLYSDGYLMRSNANGGILGYIPLLGGALSVGNLWPTAYQDNPLPDYYVDYYDLGQRDSYRYADNVIYRVDPRDSAIASVAALLTGDEFTVGQPMPQGYDVYNVPYSYRDRYYDTPDEMYRYSDGYVYRIDPKTQLVAAAIDLLI